MTWRLLGREYTSTYDGPNLWTPSGSTWSGNNIWGDDETGKTVSVPDGQQPRTPLECERRG